MPKMSKSRNTTDKLPPVHPGEILKETLDDLEISMNRLSKEICVPANRISSIIAGQRAITGGDCPPAGSILRDHAGVLAEHAGPIRSRNRTRSVGGPRKIRGAAPPRSIILRSSHRRCCYCVRVLTGSSALAASCWRACFRRSLAAPGSVHFLQRPPLGLRADVAVPREHLPGDVAGDLHDGLVARARLGEFGDQGVPSHATGRRRPPSREPYPMPSSTT